MKFVVIHATNGEFIVYLFILWEIVGGLMSPFSGAVTIFICRLFHSISIMPLITLETNTNMLFSPLNNTATLFSTTRINWIDMIQCASLLIFYSPLMIILALHKQYSVCIKDKFYGNLAWELRLRGYSRVFHLQTISADNQLTFVNENINVLLSPKESIIFTT